MNRKIVFLAKISSFIARPGQGKSLGNCLASASAQESDMNEDKFMQMKNDFTVNVYYAYES